MLLKINNHTCDLYSEVILIPEVDVSHVPSSELLLQGRNLNIELPATPKNVRIFGFTHQIGVIPKFNNAYHHAEISAEGSLLFQGSVRLTKVLEDRFQIEIREGGTPWAKEAAKGVIGTLSVPFTMTLTPTSIIESWEGDSPVKFFPIQRDDYPPLNNPTDLYPAYRFLSIDDYHPFLHIASLMKAIMEKSGYEIESHFFGTPFFQSLYMSGAYRQEETLSKEMRMGFFARRVSSVSAQANSSGRVYANPSHAFNTLGNIVQTATPNTTDQEGNIISGLKNNGECLKWEDGQVTYTPKGQVKMAFEYYLRYTTQHKIIDRNRLKGFDRIYLGTDSTIDVPLMNRYEDRRSTLKANRQYRLIVFAHQEGAEYQFTYSANGINSIPSGVFSTRTTLIQTFQQGIISNPKLWLRDSTGWEEYTGDWAMYDGHIEERGETSVELRLTTQTEVIDPLHPKYFNQIYFEGAEEGQRLTLHKETSLRSIFSTTPGLGSQISWKDVAQQPIHPLELIFAISHLFNLRFETDRQRKIVRIEPESDFYAAQGEDPLPIDWSNKQVEDDTPSRSDLALDVHQVRTLAYRQGTGAVARFEVQCQERFGAWSHLCSSFAAKMGEEQNTNPLFQPTLNAEGYLRSAPSASILIFGDRDLMEDNEATLRPRIVSYAGMQPLPKGERWSYPFSEEKYPLVAFFHQGKTREEGFSLCFEDRDGVRGLNQFYEQQYQREDETEKVTLRLQLLPHEYNLLVYPPHQKLLLPNSTPNQAQKSHPLPSCHSSFFFRTAMGDCTLRLQKIGAYNPETMQADCTFIRI